MDWKRYRGGSILAIDSATVSGFCEGEPGATPVLETINFGGREFDQHPDILARVVKYAGRRFSDQKPGLMIIEEVPPLRDKTLQNGISGILIGIAAAKDIPVLVAPIRSWRASVLGDGRLPGKVAKQRAIGLTAQLGWAPQGDDAAESACIWLYACTYVAPRTLPRLPLFMRGAA